MAKATWGDPTTESFRKKHIREMRAGGGFALVHEKILAVTERLVESLSSLHVDIPEVIPSYDERGTEAQRLGLALHLNVTPTPEIAATVERWKFDGFKLESTSAVELRFVGSPDEAVVLNEEAIAAKLDALESPEVSGPPARPWPGQRDLEAGMTGADVTFLRCVLGCGLDEPVDDDLVDAVKMFQLRRGAPVTGVIDVQLWRRLLPKGRPTVSQGDSGFLVRIVQAALITYEGGSNKVTGTWGVLTDRDVRLLQEAYNLRRATFVRSPEWAILIGPVQERIENAQNAGGGAIDALPSPTP